MFYLRLQNINCFSAIFSLIVLLKYQKTLRLIRMEHMRISGTEPSLVILSQLHFQNLLL